MDNTKPAHRIMNAPCLRNARRELRTNGTAAEGALWTMLKAKRIGGLQFRRQFGVGKYVLDFYCPKLRLAVELDGDYHHHAAQPEWDRQRDEWLWKEHGIYVLRFENKVVFENPQTITQTIMKYQQAVFSADV